MKMKNKCGMIVGRFQHIHKGHERLINIGLGECEKVLVFVSCDEDSSDKNPFDVNYRIGLIEKIFIEEVKAGRLVIKPLKTPDTVKKYVPSWGSFLLREASDIMGERVDSIIYGNDKNILKCFSIRDLRNINDIKVNRENLKISATDVRNILSIDDKQEWEKNVNSRIYNEYDYLKNKLLS